MSPRSGKRTDSKKPMSGYTAVESEETGLAKLTLDNSRHNLYSTIPKQLKESPKGSKDDDAEMTLGADQGHMDSVEKLHRPM